MDTLRRLNALSDQMTLEPAEEIGCSYLPQSSQLSIENKPARTTEPAMFQAKMPGGKTISLLKTLQTSACERNCYYCPFRAGRDFRRETLTPDELAATYIGLNQAGIAQGLFLSSGIAGGGIKTQDRLLATVEILRRKYAFKGYIHLKIMPGAERDQVLQAMKLANRVSINLEAPNSLRLEQLAPRKVFLEELLEPLRWVAEMRRSIAPEESWNFRWPSTTTQFVVGAAGETDLELLQTTETLHRDLGLARAYFSAFNPIKDTPLENLSPENPLRQHRLYQASFLLRDYGFSIEEMSFLPNGRLPLEIDPKIAWARENLLHSPLEINLAAPEQLMRIPGIGHQGVNRIVSARSKSRLRSMDDLKRIGINPSRSAPYILIDGRQPTIQLQLL